MALAGARLEPTASESRGALRPASRLARVIELLPSPVSATLTAPLRVTSELMSTATRRPERKAVDLEATARTRGRLA